MRRRLPDRFAAASPRQSGAVLLVLIFGVVLLATLAMGVALLTGGRTATCLTDNRDAQAYYLALSGLNIWSAGTTGRFRVAGNTVTLAQAGPDAQGYYTVTSSGCIHRTATLEANAVITAKRAGLSTITFTDDLDDFALPVVGKTENDADAITVYGAEAPPSRGGANGLDSTGYASGSLRLGGGTKGTDGAIWYTGSRGACRDGQCPFGSGLRAYFGFVFLDRDISRNSTARGDGFTFTIMNAVENDPETAAGGPASGSRGEYLGYAGPGPSGGGIAAPKLAVEMDVYPNTGGYPPEHVNSRHDHSAANHVAVVFWGDEGLYDDNIHGRGGLPGNPIFGDPGPGYVETAHASGQPNWLEDAEEHTMRLEIDRADDETGGAYRIKVWIDGTGAAIDDVTRDYADTAPQLDYTTSLGAADHAKLDTVLFGWTESTGDATQDVAIHDFRLAFRR